MAGEKSGKLSRQILKRRLRPLLLVGIVLLTVTEIVALSPSSIETSIENKTVVEPETLIRGSDEATLATGIPKAIPEYSVEQFNYASVQGGEKQWKIKADRAYMFNEHKLVHARTITAYLYDQEDNITVITGLEAKYFMNKRDLEVFGNVKTVFPDGFVLYSEYLRYRPLEKKIEIPVQYPVRGAGSQSDNQRLSFTSHGMDFSMGTSQILLPEAVRFTMEQKGPKNDNNRGVADKTVIESDRAMIYRDKQLAKFTMSPYRPDATRFVHITQPNVFSRSRRADLNYGLGSGILQYLTAYEDVLIKETGADTGEMLRYSTSGRADFDSKKDVIHLTEFPQVYQGEDTITGDLILVHKDTDIVEVENSNAFTEGK